MLGENVPFGTPGLIVLDSFRVLGIVLAFIVIVQCSTILFSFYRYKIKYEKLTINATIALIFAALACLLTLIGLIGHPFIWWRLPVYFSCMWFAIRYNEGLKKYRARQLELQKLEEAKKFLQR